MMEAGLEGVYISIYAFLFILGLFIGSFYNVVAIRLCKNESIVFPGSHCVNCNHRLAWYELIPVFSYIFLKGKCKVCKQHISIQYPIIELATGILFAFSFYLYGFSYETIISIILSSVVIITFITDSRYMIILDEVLAVGGGFIIITNIVAYFLGAVEMSLILIHLLVALILFLVMILIRLLGNHAFKTESLGWGDIKLSILAGLVLGLNFKDALLLSFVYIFLGSFLALPYALYISIKKKDSLLPFGPFLAASMLIIFWNMNFILELISKLYVGVL